jgi:prepilin signal peptidase PulO-like enzyme (type II secretory pathway)
MWALVLLLGWVAGGLANALADSLPASDRLARPFCHGCGAPRPPAAWLAGLAYLTGNRVCRYCGRPLRARGLLVELVGAAGALLIYQYDLGPSGPWMAILVSWVFLLIVIIDIEHRLILNVVSLPAIVVFGVVFSLDPGRGASKTLLGGGVGLGVVLMLFLFGALFARWASRRRGEPLQEVAFGFGDVMLSAVIGLVVGWPGVVLALFIGVLAAGAFSLAVMLIQLARGRYSPYMPFPYGPFLVMGALLVYLGGSGLFSGPGAG